MSKMNEGCRNCVKVRFMYEQQSVCVYKENLVMCVDGEIMII